MTIAWTAPGDDGIDGRATSYDIRYSTGPISEGKWGADARQVPNGLVPEMSGDREELRITGLPAHVLYRIAVKAADEVPNWSEMSNVAVDSTFASPEGVRVTRSAWVNTAPSWSDDGSRILFAAFTAGNFACVSTVPPTGGEEVRLTDPIADSYTEPRWSPTANSIAFTDDEGSLEVVDAAGGGAAVAVEAVGDARITSPDWSPDGRWLAFTISGSGHSGIYIAEVAGSRKIRALYDHATSSATAPRWSPDGLTIAFSAGGVGSVDADIFTMPSAGGTVTQITNGPGWKGVPRWSPDGRTIAFVLSSGTTGRVCTVAAAGGDHSYLTGGQGNEFAPEWSPDGATVYFTSDLDGTRGIYSVPAGGGQPVPVTTGPVGIGELKVSPDGRSIAFTARKDRPAGRPGYDIYVLRL